MKLLIASDLHGSAYYTRKLLDVFDGEHADRMLLLGDLLYHGPRNDLPREYAPKQVIDLLNARADRLFCVRGNCDSEVDQMVLHFPILAEYAVLFVGERILYATHGHKTAELALAAGTVLLSGHTHVPLCREQDGILSLNPGSVSIPKEQSPHSYMTLEDGKLCWKDLDSGECFLEHTL